jgi:hypothetical protein
MLAALLAEILAQPAHDLSGPSDLDLRITDRRGNGLGLKAPSRGN